MLKLISFLFLLSHILADTTHDVTFRGNTQIPVTDDAIDKYPYQISVLVYGSFICGGSIISANWVLTSAQCIVYSPSSYTVRTGSPKSGGTVYSVSSLTQHPDYVSRVLDYDIGLIRISGSFIFDTNVQPVNLATVEPSEGDVAIAIGYSKSDLQLPIVSREQCSSPYAVTERMLCAGDMSGGRDLCQGNVGGPLVLNGDQVGIVSLGYGCGLPNHPGIYTNVANLRSWINEISGV